MHSSMVEQLRKYQKRNRRQRVLKKFVQVLGCVVVFVTTYALILPAITMEQQLFCGLEEHIHTDACEEKQYVSVLDCTPEKLSIHVHQTECYDDQNALICSTPDYIAHTHSELCFDEADQLVCTVPERDVHQHNENCYISGENPAEVLHIHGEDCFRTERGGLVCTQEECSGHLHDESCYAAGETLLCTVVEDHEHAAACYQKELICTEPELPGHCHDDSCYEYESVLCCGLEEGQPEPTEPAEKILVCTEPIASVHVHSESCFFVTEQERTVLNCQTEEHTHNLVCYSDPEADLEKEEVWKATFAEVELTDDLIENLLAIAQTQIGYTESSRNYHVWDDNTIHGYTRYGDWYGDPYGEWSAMFASFCLHYAKAEDEPFIANGDPNPYYSPEEDIEQIPYGSDINEWIDQLDELDRYYTVEEIAPERGYLIFCDEDEDGETDRVGIVAEIKAATEHTGASIEVIEGDSDKAVSMVSYRPEDETIVGYAVLGDKMESEPESDQKTDPETDLNENPEADSNENPEVGPNENPDAEENSGVEDTGAVSITAQIYTDGTYETLAGDAVVMILTGSLPEDAVVKAYPVSLQTEMDLLFAYDISIFRADGSVFEPSDGEAVKVLIQSSALENTQEEFTVYHIPEEGEPSLVESEISDGELRFDVSHFSVYAVARQKVHEDVFIGAQMVVSGGMIYQDTVGEAVLIPDNQFNFQISDESGTVVSTGTANSNGEILFAEELPFGEDGTYTYYVQQKVGTIPGIEYDKTLYRITVSISENISESLDGATTTTECVVENIKVEKQVSDGADWEVISAYKPDVSESGSVELALGENTFVNVFCEIPAVTNLKVNIVWTDPEDTVPVMVALQQNGEIYDTVAVTAEMEWTYTWEELPVTDEAGEYYEYTVQETDSIEFDATYEEAQHEDGTPVIIITNTRRLYNLEVTKVSDHNIPKPLEGAKLQIINSDREVMYFVQKEEEEGYTLSAYGEEGAIDELTTDVDGKVYISDLKAGEYVVEEMEALEGYLLAEAAPVMLTNENTDENGTYSVTIVNELIGYEIPETGGAGVTLYITAGLMLVMSALVLLYNKKLFGRT